MVVTQQVLEKADQTIEEDFEQSLGFADLLEVPPDVLVAVLKKSLVQVPSLSYSKDIQPSTPEPGA